MRKRREKSILSMLVMGFLIFGVQSQASAADDPDALVQAAWNANPSLSAMEEKIEAANQKIPQAGVWMDPMIAVEYSNVPVDTFTLGDHPMSGIQFKLQQTFPFPGKTGKRKRVAESMAEVDTFKLTERKNQIRGLVKSTYWNLTLVRSLKQITERHIDQVDHLLASVRSRYEVGGAGQQDLLRLQVLRDRLQDELLEFDRKDVQLSSKLNTLLAHPIETPIQTPENFEAVKPVSNEQAAYESSLASRPILAVWNQVAKAQELAAKRAAYEGWPDPTIWTGYRWREEVLNDQGMVMDEGVDFFSVGISFPIPIFNGSRWGALKRESLAKKRSAESTRASLADDIRGELKGAYAAWRRAYDKSETYATTIRPGQQQTLNATLSAYQVGRADFTSLYAAEVGLLDVERALVTAKSETRIQQANVENLVGENIPAQGDKK